MADGNSTLTADIDESNYSSRLFNTCSELETTLAMTQPLLGLLSESADFRCNDPEQAIEAQGRIIALMRVIDNNFGDIKKALANFYAITFAMRKDEKGAQS